MKPPNTSHVLVLILCLSLLFGTLMNCGGGGDRSLDKGSTVTLLCPHENEKSVFKDGKSTMFLMFLTLVSEDETGRFQPRLLESWEHSDDFRRWIFHLRRDVRWHDGQPVTAGDVKFTLELITNHEIWYENEFFDTIEVVDSYTLEIRSDKPVNPLPYCSWYGILPDHLLGDLDVKEFHYWPFWTHPVGDGPYRYVRHVPDTVVELEANPDYFGEKPKIERVELRFSTNPVTELLSGNVDAANYLRPNEVIRMAEDPRFRVYYEFKFNIANAIIWNHQNPLFQSPDVRRALTQAINRQELHRVLNFPESTPIFDAMFHKSHYYRGELPIALPYDPEGAKKLLEDAGWLEKSPGGVRENQSRKFHFTLLITEEYEMAAIYIQDKLRKVGVVMEITTLEPIHLVSRSKSVDWEAILTQFNPLVDGRALNLYSPELQTLIDKAVSMTTIDAFADAVQKLWPEFREELPITILYPYIQFNVVNKRIRGLESPYRAYPAKFMEYLWIDESW